MHGRRPDKLEEIAREVAELSGHAPATVLGDIQDPAVRSRIFRTTLKTFFTIDGLVNNAGWASVGGWENENLEAMQHMLDIHVLGPYDLCRKALPYIIKNKGSIVMVSSIASMRAVSGEVPLSFFNSVETRKRSEKKIVFFVENVSRFDRFLGW